MSIGEKDPDSRPASGFAVGLTVRVPKGKGWENPVPIIKLTSTNIDFMCLMMQIRKNSLMLPDCHMFVASLTWAIRRSSISLSIISASGIIPGRISKDYMAEDDDLRKIDIVRAWGRILVGRAPSMSIEITKRCPLSCPGCYAYGSHHLGLAGGFTELQEFEGMQLVRRILSLVDHHRPLHLSIVGGEPLVRWREISQLIPELEKRDIHTQIVTSAVSQIPHEWRNARRLTLVVSIDGLPAEHDRRRAPATYERILKHIRGHNITVHCTITRQMTYRPGYLREFVKFWAEQSGIQKIWMSLYTPQIGEESPEILTPQVREEMIDELSVLRESFHKLELPPGLLQSYRHPPADPCHCVFAQTTQTISVDLKTKVAPCQLGGTPDCSQCGCIAAAAMEAVNRHRLPIGLRAGTIYGISRAFGLYLRRLTDAGSEASLFDSNDTAICTIRRPRHKEKHAKAGCPPKARMDNA
jgi:MoaA/NifB/PqqE/SkfB family radical SAM enzyme